MSLDAINNFQVIVKFTGSIFCFISLETGTAIDDAHALEIDASHATAATDDDRATETARGQGHAIGIDARDATTVQTDAARAVARSHAKGRRRENASASAASDSCECINSRSLITKCVLSLHFVYFDSFFSEMTPEERDARTVFCMQLAARIRSRELEEFFSSVGKVRTHSSSFFTAHCCKVYC